MNTQTQIVHRYMDGFRRSDHDAILACLTDDVVWHIHGLRTTHGKAEFDDEIENPAFEGSPELTVEQNHRRRRRRRRHGHRPRTAPRAWALPVRLQRPVHLPGRPDRPGRLLRRPARLTGSATSAGSVRSRLGTVGSRRRDHRPSSARCRPGSGGTNRCEQSSGHDSSDGSSTTRVEREDVGGARGRRARHRLLAELDAGQAGRVSGCPRRVLEVGHRQHRLERLPLEHRPAGDDAGRAPSAGARHLLRPEPRHLLRRRDEQQRRQRRADRFARTVLHRADRRVALQGAPQPGGAACSRSSRSAVSPWCCSAHPRTATRR